MHQSELIWTVGGMTCNQCVKKITAKLVNLPGVDDVKVNLAQNTVKIVYDDQAVTEAELEAAIRQAGYTVGKNYKPEQNQTRRSVGLILVVLAIYLILNRLGVFTFVPEVASGMSYIMLFAVGILTSFHCIAMCGGINLAITGSQSGQNKRHAIPTEPAAPGKNFLPGFLYNAGRITSYTIIGGLAGALGGVFSFTDSARNTIMVIAGLFMILMGAKMIGVFQRVPLPNLPLPRFFSRWSEKIRGSSPYLVGLLNGFMPCGPLQTMQIYALGTASFLSGALSMFFFSIGTAPLMLGLSFIAGSLNEKRNKMLRYASAVLVIVLGLQMAGRVIAPAAQPLTGWLRSQSASSVSAIASVNGDYQEVSFDLAGGRYKPIVVQAGMPVRWTITAEAGDINGCNRMLYLEGYDGQVTLTPGDNIIEFTPLEPGTIRYACWMNMIVSSITVVEDISSLPDLAESGTPSGIQTEYLEEDSFPLPACCCCVD